MLISRRNTNRPAGVPTAPRRAFTLVELMVVMAIIGILTAIILPAVQYSREAARRATCKNNLRQMGLALQSFHAANNQFPAGRDGLNDLDHSWVTTILPHLEQAPLYDRYDFSKPWYDGGPGAGNYGLGETVLSVMRCPSSIVRWDGDTDYGGMMGSSLSGLPLGETAGTAGGSGILIATNQFQRDPVNLGLVLDGASNTIMVAENSDCMNANGRWSAGWNCFAQYNSGVNTQPQNGIGSYHSGTALALMADGSVQSLTESMELYVLGALCTRDASEVVKW